MFSSNDPGFDADRLDQLWDNLQQTGARSESVTDTNGRLFVSLVDDLDLSAPTITSRQHARIWEQVRFPNASLPAVKVVTRRAGIEKTSALGSIPLRARPMPGRYALGGPILRIAATAVLLLGFLATWLVLRGGGDDPGSYPQLAASSPEKEIGPPTSAQGSDRLTTTATSEGELGFALLEISLPPGADWQLSGLGSSQFWVKSGKVLFVGGADQVRFERSEGAFFTASQASGTVAPTVVNESDDPAVVIQGTVFPASSYSNIDSIGTAHNATIRWLAFDTQEVPTWPGELTLNLRSEANTGGASYNFQEIRIGTVLNGDGNAVSLGGDISVLQRPSSGLDSTPDLEPDSLDLGNSVLISPGSAIIMHPFSGLRIDSTADASELLWLSFVSIPSSSEAVAAQALHDDINSVMQVASTDCTIQPRTTDQFAEIFDSADAIGTPSPGVNPTDGSATPADDVTIRSVVSTLKQVVACSYSFSLLQRYSLYSENMLHFLSLNGSLTMGDIESATEATTGNFSGNPSIVGQVAIDNVERFPDGRVGAVVNANGKIAYVTFVNEGGQWLIDYWDDSELPATPTP